MNNSTIRDCGSTSSNEGGSVFFGLSEGGLLEINHTNVTECFCSNIGRGGGMFLKSQSASQKALPFVLSNITFRGNAALKGRDVFVKCTDLDSQISESQFLINFGEPFVKELAIWGCTADNYEDEEDLLGRVYVFRSEFIFVSSIVGNSSDSKNCGEMKSACSSLNVGVSHIIPSDYSQLFIWNETALTGSCSAQKVTTKSMESNRNAEIKVSEVELAGEEVVRTSESVRFERVSLVFDGMCNIACSCLIRQLNGFLFLGSVSFLAESGSLWNSQNNLDFSLLTVEDGLLEGSECSICSLQLAKSAFRVLTSESVKFQDLTISNVQCLSSVIECGISQSVSISKLKAENTTLQNGCMISSKESSSLLFSLSLSSFANISRSSSGPSVIFTSHAKSASEMFNCSFCECASASAKGSQVAMVSADEMMVDQCKFEGNLAGGSEEMNVAEEGICEWNGSVVDFSDCVTEIRDTTVCDSSKGGLTASGGAVTIEACNFNNNNPSILHYPSVRRNIICSDFGVVNVMSVKGGDGLERNTSLWILNDGCSFEGIVSERDSSFFIPVLESVEAKEETDRMKLTFKGMLLVPCNLSFAVVKKNGEEKEIEKHDFETNGFLTEREVEGSVGKDLVSNCGEEVEVSVYILFGDKNSPSSTDSIILKNRSVKVKDDERISEEDNKIEWSLIAFIGCVIVVAILLFVIIIIVVLKKKQNKGKRKVGDGDIEGTKNIVRGEWRKEDVVQREEEEEDKVQVVLDGETGNEMGMSTEKVEELDVHENKEVIENTFDCEEVIGVMPVNYVEMQTVALLQSCGEDGSMESAACAGGIEDQNMRKGDGKAKRGKRRKGKKRRQVEEIDEIGDERGGSEIGLNELGGAASDDGRNGSPTEYYIGICSAPNSHFSMIGDDSEDQGMKRTMEEERKVVKEVREEEGEVIKLKKRKKKKKKNQKREDKSEIVKDVAEMGLIDAG
ncbi:uncharacterized protein MONOS_13287 [Monocercomonoides exilis]|uniref:uncharacterized protein n=1 Tax=Monocercomonoides exilis TaxID=2049356 RepID=UPI0035594CA2|nr:hypothetical protein MONOS_13287 [Monocercomonoides exilis]|eukprot:MONOS_13287.1-p1 / transcript=MONOS_13287.1 / gene=MONOS_13287 / organism=Monocercomonoides_exilis_PA203 / gene_product=unspecified product / transcript_product=unspecified product / location=Mono_scaffold00804:128-3013(+) / protein_length=962 / sequence_SO=supercontig / SO=protein_coding / is_pseudo=false